MTTQLLSNNTSQPDRVTNERQELYVQGSAKRRSPSLVDFVTALAYLFCLGLRAAFTQPGDHLNMQMRE